MNKDHDEMEPTALSPTSSELDQNLDDINSKVLQLVSEAQTTLLDTPDAPPGKDAARMEALLAKWDEYNTLIREIRDGSRGFSTLELKMITSTIHSFYAIQSAAHWKRMIYLAAKVNDMLCAAREVNINVHSISVDEAVKLTDTIGKYAGIMKDDVFLLRERARELEAEQMKHLEGRLVVHADLLPELEELWWGALS